MNKDARRHKAIEINYKEVKLGEPKTHKARSVLHSSQKSKEITNNILFKESSNKCKSPHQYDSIIAEYRKQNKSLGLHRTKSKNQTKLRYRKTLNTLSKTYISSQSNFDLHNENNPNLAKSAKKQKYEMARNLKYAMTTMNGFIAENNKSV